MFETHRPASLAGVAGKSRVCVKLGVPSSTNKVTVYYSRASLVPRFLIGGSRIVSQANLFEVAAATRSSCRLIRAGTNDAFRVQCEACEARDLRANFGGTARKRLRDRPEQELTSEQAVRD